MVDSTSKRTSRFDFGERNSNQRTSVAPVQSLGALLRERREAMGVSLAEVEAATRIRQKYLSAIENDEWHLLPGEVVGRGFLRNYGEYLGVDPTEVVERRRAVVDPNLVAALSTTSAGSALPPERQIDYRPKEVDLKDESDGIQRGEIKLTPILPILGVALAVALLWWGVTKLQEPASALYTMVVLRATDLFAGSEPTQTPGLVGIVNVENLTPIAPATTGVPAVALGQGVEGAAPALSAGAAPPATAGDAGTGDTGGIGGAINSGSEGGPVTPGAQEAAAVVAAVASPTPTTDPNLSLIPTATPPAGALPPVEAAAAEAPTAIPPTPTFTPVPPTPEVPTETPTETPTPEPPTPEPQVFASPSCADARSVISGLGMGQAVSGAVTIGGSATFDNFQYYKLEYAPGANAGGGFVYFDGRSVPVEGGALGTLNTAVLPNGEYTIRLTVVDQTGNYAPPCDVSIVIQN